MLLTTDLQAFARLDRALSGTIKTVSDKAIARAALKQALLPMLQAAKSESPSLSGATRRGTRIRMVSGQPGEVAKGLVGVSKKSGSVGWRTHLITRPNRNRSVANDFLGRAERQELPGVEARYAQSVEDAITKAIARL